MVPKYKLGQYIKAGKFWGRIYKIEPKNDSFSYCIRLSLGGRLCIMEEFINKGKK